MKQNEKSIRKIIDNELTSLIKDFHNDKSAWVRFNQFEIIENENDNPININITYRIDGELNTIDVRADLKFSSKKILLTVFYNIENIVNK